ncbi:flavonol synthase/flavanone 3-hydroxylase-like [Olea europaea var. sylvestris]|uniref:flavonol synthase/flavanone 3-hydroxylase-like n=1 Tax=Olea europaea var. sylvestris TaxID=158386 RepID=UPI000C1D580F|nr:flavonol synthase/flavanone 3-hydroxylase-like [Olea europaea var. sylvestris]
MATLSHPTVDLSVFLKDGEEEEKKRAKEIISHACSEYGFFQAVNHEIPLELMSRAMELTKIFFALPEEEKRKYRPKSGEPESAGYGKMSAHGIDLNEYILMLPPQSSSNVLPNDPPELRPALEELFNYFCKTGELVESILNDCLGLPPDFLKKYNDDRSSDILTTRRYFPASENDNIGLPQHTDGNFITFVFQDEVGGLEVLKDGEWTPIVSVEGTIVVNVGDVIQVLTNNKFKSAPHRVLKQKGRSRHSITYFYSLQGDKSVEPLPHYTKQIGEPPKYRGFMVKDYRALRIRNRTHPPSRREDVIDITHYAIPHN